MYSIEPLFYIKLFFLLAIFFLLMFVFNSIIRKYLKIEKRKVFSYAYVNEKHKKIDWIIRISFIIILFISNLYQRRNIGEVKWYFEIWFIAFVFIVISDLFRAFMEWKYAENPKTFIFTISQLIFILGLLGILFASNFFNLF